jgi:hypothetical protein
VGKSGLPLETDIKADVVYRQIRAGADVALDRIANRAKPRFRYLGGLIYGGSAGARV